MFPLYQRPSVYAGDRGSLFHSRATARRGAVTFQLVEFSYTWATYRRACSRAWGLGFGASLPFWGAGFF